MFRVTSILPSIDLWLRCFPKFFKPNELELTSGHGVSFKESKTNPDYTFKNQSRSICLIMKLILQEEDATKISAIPNSF